MTGLTGAVYLSQRRHDLVVRELYATLLLVRHVAVGTRHPTLGMDALLRHLVARMLSLQDWRLGYGMDIVVEAYRVIVFLSSLECQALVVREHQIVGLAGIVGIVGLDEVVLHVALGAYQRAHLLMALLLHVETSAGECLIERRTGRTQVHRGGIVTVGATHGVHHLGSQSAPLALIGIVVSGIEDRLLVA